MAQHHMPKFTTNGLIMYLDAGNRASYAGSGTAWRDMTQSGNSCTLYGSPAYSGDNLGYLTFSSASSNFAENAAPVGLIGNVAVTLSCWIYPTTMNGGNQAVLNYGGDATAGDTFAINLYTDTRAWSMAFNGANDMASNASAYTVNTWNYLVATKTPGAANTTTKLYVNGSEVAVATTTTVTPNVVARVIRVGRWVFNSQPSYFNGRVSCATIHNRALTAAEVLQNFNATRGRFRV